MSVIDTRERKVVHAMPVAQKPDIIVISPDGKVAFATSREDKALVIIDLVNHKQMDSLPLGGDPHGVAFFK